MPRFLNTRTGEFEWHADPTQVTYAILSHVWRSREAGGEQSYDDVRRIQEEVKENRWVPAPFDLDVNACPDTSMAWAPFAFISLEDIDSIVPGTIFTHPGLSDKIKGFCKVAREAGFRLAWNDACCIDKSSSAELSEAINSMYEWYRLSDMCYVYLSDVPDDDFPTHLFPPFRRSKWHERGWTLQELIAPERIIFLSRTWNILGTKMGLAKTLERITGVDFDILVGRATLDSASVARRMSWAARRRTTRVEDRAYSLLGIFGLHMSPIYGEGKNAFLRLQEEIIRTIPDQSIFVWGAHYDLGLSREGEWWAKSRFRDHDKEGRGLLTSSPTSFSDSLDIEPIASASLAETLGIQESQVPPVYCIFTPEGINMRLICLPLSGVPEIRNMFPEGPQSARDICAECRELGELDTLAFLQCQERHETGTTSILGLLLCRSRREDGGSNRRAFHIGGHFHDDKNHEWPYRTVGIDIGDLAELLKHVRPTVDDVTLLRHYSGPSVPKSLQWNGVLPCVNPYKFSFFSYLKDTAIQISPHSVDALRTLGIDLSPLQVTHSEQEIILETTLAFDRDSGAGPTDLIAVRLSITKCSHDEGEANVSVRRVGGVGSGSGQSSIGASAGASHHTVVNTPHISDGCLDLNHPNDSRMVIPCGVRDIYRRTIVHIEYTVHSDGRWARLARVLRIALQNTFASPPAQNRLPPDLWVSIDLSEKFPYASRTESGLDSPSSQQTDTDVCKRDSETSNEHEDVSPSCESTALPVSADRATVYASRDNAEALPQENDAQTVQTNPAAYHTSSPHSPTSTPSLPQRPACVGSSADASSGPSGSNDGPAHSEPTRSSAEPAQRADRESLGDEGAQHAMGDVCEDYPCGREIAALRAEIEQLKRQNAEMASRMDAVFARFDALTAASAVKAA